MATAAHLEKLNPAQRKAVTHGQALPEKGYRAGPLLIVAGAGTGKTDTLAHRVAHLVIHGVDPARIMMLTFTRRAATEMRRRAQEITRQALNEPLGGVSHSIAQRLSWTGTFHSIGNRLLRHYAPHLQLDPHFSVIDRADAADLIDSLRQELGLAGKEQRFPRKETCLQIYSNRAAAVENILGFAERFQPAAEVVTLAQNYRSTQQVLDVANALMAEAPRQHRKYLLSVRGEGTRPRLVTVDELQSQAEYVCQEVLRRREANVPLKRQAVLFRSASHSDLLEVELAKRKVPFVKYGGLRFLEAAHIKDLLAVLRWADNPRNTLAAFRTLQLLPGMGPVNARTAIERLEAGGHSFEALKAFSPPETAELDWRRLIELMQSLADAQRPWPGQLQLAREWYRPHFERLYEQFHTRRGDLEQLEVLAGQYPSRERFLTELTLNPPHATSDLAGRPSLDEDYLVLSTIHSAKGMEWDTVYVLNVVDGSFPSEFSTGRPELIEEERRLLYVALTRARNDLLLIVPLKFHLTHQPRQADAHVYGGRSRFMTEKVHKTLEAVSFHGSAPGAADTLRGSSAPVTLDVGARLREMW